MNTVEIIRHQARMCTTCDVCNKCPIGIAKKPNESCATFRAHNSEKIVELVEKWNKEHPEKTMMQDFFEKFPDAPREESGEPKCCPSSCGYVKEYECPGYDSNHPMTCYECWSRPLENQ